MKNGDDWVHYMQTEHPRARSLIESWPSARPATAGSIPAWRKHTLPESMSAQRCVEVFWALSALGRVEPRTAEQRK